MASIAIPVLLPEELVSALQSVLLILDEVISLATIVGLNGCDNKTGSSPPLLDSNGNIEASSSGKNVETDGDSSRVCGSSTSRNAGSVDISMLLNLKRYPLNKLLLS